MSSRIRANRIHLFIIIIVFLSSVTFFILGLSYPILHTKKHIIGLTLSSDNVWLFTSIEYFFQADEYLLGAIILTFTVIFPIIKYLELTNRVFHLLNLGQKTSKFLSYTDKWSMLDVFIVALLIMNYKMDSSLVSMEICIGTTFFAISIILRMILSNMKVKRDSFINL